jgi:hypothetical protein
MIAASRYSRGMQHDLDIARKNARTDADAAAIAWAQDEIERLRSIIAQISDVLLRAAKL